MAAGRISHVRKHLMGTTPRPSTSHLKKSHQQYESILIEFIDNDNVAR